MGKAKAMTGNKAKGADTRPVVLLMVDYAPLRGFLRQVLAQYLPQSVARDPGPEGVPEALSQLSQGAVDLVLLDLEAEGIDGRAFLGLARSKERPVMALSGRITPDLLRAFQGDPGVWFVEKPAAAEEIVEVARRFLRA